MICAAKEWAGIRTGIFGTSEKQRKYSAPSVPLGLGASKAAQTEAWKRRRGTQGQVFGAL